MGVGAIEGTETVVRPAEGVELAVEVLGPADAPVLLLLGGATWSRDWWDDDLCARLVSGGGRVVRYDQRDTGASTCWPAGAPGYGADDLVGDAVAVLDAVGVDRAHVVGLSLGGGLAQRLALAHRDRVAALTLIATTPLEDTGEELPGPSGEFPDPDDGLDPVTAIIEGERPCAPAGAFDEELVRAVAARVVARGRDLASATNHFLLADTPPAGRLADLAGLPTTVVHGGADPLFPPAHGRALAAAIPGARYVELPGIGHQLPPRWDRDRLVAVLTDR